MHLKMRGWPVTACNREPWLLNMEMTENPAEAECQPCQARMARLSAVEIYAGQEIRVSETDFWDSMSRAFRFRYCRRHPETAGLEGFAWYQFSREQRRQLLGEILREGAAAWSLGLPGQAEPSVNAEASRQMIKTARKITGRVLSGGQPVEHLGRVVDILNQLGRTLVDD